MRALTGGLSNVREGGEAERAPGLALGAPQGSAAAAVVNAEQQGSNGGLALDELGHVFHLLRRARDGRCT
jgi:hypothetical protein